ncbi:MAG: hypothetical protein ABIG20_04755 [archaeon]
MKKNLFLVIPLLLITYFLWWQSLDVQIVYFGIFFGIPGILLALNVLKFDSEEPVPLQINNSAKLIIAYFIAVIAIGGVWSILWVGMSPSFYNVEDGADFNAQEVDLAELKETTLFQTSVVRKVPENTGGIRLRANRFGWADVIDTDPVYEEGELVWRAVIEPRGLINQLTKSAPGVSQTSAEIEASPVVTEIDLEHTEAKLFWDYSKRRAWYHNRLWLVDDGYITTDADGGYWWVYPRTSINWFIFTYKKSFEGVTLVNAKNSDITHYNPDELQELSEFLGGDVRCYPESLALQQANVYGYNRFGWWAKHVTQRSSDGESLYEIPGGQLSSSSSTWQKYPFLTVYNDKLYWVVVYEPIGGEISGARIAGILLVGADHTNSGEITLLKLDKLERNLAGVNKIFRFARAEVQNFEGWIPQQVQIYQDEDKNLYALSSIVSGSGSGQRIMALAGVNLLGEEERAYVIKTAEYSNLDDVHAALLKTMFGGAEVVEAEESVVETPAAVSDEDIEKRLDEIDAKLDTILEKLGEE